jgi:hypothetical protein
MTHVDCKVGTSKWKYNFAMDDQDGRYFCYMGCMKKYDQVEKLERHLARSHLAEELKCWGISLDHLRFKYEIQYDSDDKCSYFDFQT